MFLCNTASLGSNFARYILEAEILPLNFLNIGEEASNGTATVKAAYELRIIILQ
jgi:fatty acid/phospholipid biosynthesis enzyme